MFIFIYYLLTKNITKIYYYEEIYRYKNNYINI